MPKTHISSCGITTISSKVFSTAVPHSTFSELRYQLFVEGKNCDGILALVSERYLNPDAVKDEAVSVAKNTSTVPGSYPHARWDMSGADSACVAPRSGGLQLAPSR
eukprot:1549486-Rhodomonas_salina.3